MGKAELRIEVDAELLAKARDAGLRIEEIAEAGLRQELARLMSHGALSEHERVAQWSLANAAAIAAHEERIQALGVFGEDLRTW